MSHAMIKLDNETADTIWHNTDLSLYALYEDGSEGLVEDDEDFDRHSVCNGDFGIEGELFGKPYDEAKV